MAKKVFIKVNATFDPEGQIIPNFFEWEDGRTFKIDEILDIRRAASIKVGGVGLRYTCMVSGKQAYLFFEDNKWFIEAK